MVVADMVGVKIVIRVCSCSECSRNGRIIARVEGKKGEKKCSQKEVCVSRSRQSHVGERGPPVLIRGCCCCGAEPRSLFGRRPRIIDLGAPIALSTACNSRRRSTLHV